MRRRGPSDAGALVVHQLRLGHTSSAVLFGCIAAVLAVGLGVHRDLVAGVAGHAVLGVVAG